MAKDVCYGTIARLCHKLAQFIPKLMTLTERDNYASNHANIVSSHKVAYPGPPGQCIVVGISTALFRRE